LEILKKLNPSTWVPGTGDYIWSVLFVITALYYYFIDAECLKVAVALILGWMAAVSGVIRYELYNYHNPKEQNNE